MKFNLLALKKEEFNVKVELELTPEEMLGIAKQSHEDLQMLLDNTENIKKFITDIIDTFSKRELDIQELKKDHMQQKIKETIHPEMYWFDIYGCKKLKRNMETGGNE